LLEEFADLSDLGLKLRELEETMSSFSTNGFEYTPDGFNPRRWLKGYAKSLVNKVHRGNLPLSKA